jgi:protease I
MNRNIQGKKVAVLATHGFEQSELIEPRDALRAAGATVEVIAPAAGSIHGFKHFEQGEAVRVDRTLDAAKPGDYDALVIPGGLFSPDQLRTNDAALAFTKAMFESGKTVAAICHGPWVLVNAGLVKGRKLTSVPNIRKDLENAGAKWSDEAVVVDKGLVTSRTPKDLKPFCAKVIEEIAEGLHRDRRAAA